MRLCLFGIFVKWMCRCFQNRDCISGNHTLSLSGGTTEYKVCTVVRHTHVCVVPVFESLVVFAHSSAWVIHGWRAKTPHVQSVEHGERTRNDIHKERHVVVVVYLCSSVLIFESLHLYKSTRSNNIRTNESQWQRPAITNPGQRHHTFMYLSIFFCFSLLITPNLTKTRLKYETPPGNPEMKNEV